MQLELLLLVAAGFLMVLLSVRVQGHWVKQKLQLRRGPGLSAASLLLQAGK